MQEKILNIKSLVLNLEHHSGSFTKRKVKIIQFFPQQRFLITKHNLYTDKFVFFNFNAKIII